MRVLDARGVSLLELLVVLTVLAVLAGIAGFAGSRAALAGSNAAEDHFARARRAAVLTGRPAVVQAVDSTTGVSAPVRFLPDGRVLGEGIDPVRGPR